MILRWNCPPCPRPQSQYSVPGETWFHWSGLPRIRPLRFDTVAERAPAVWVQIHPWLSCWVAGIPDSPLMVRRRWGRVSLAPSPPPRPLPPFPRHPRFHPRGHDHGHHCHHRRLRRRHLVGPQIPRLPHPLKNLVAAVPLVVGVLIQTFGREGQLLWTRPSFVLHGRGSRSLGGWSPASARCRALGLPWRSCAGNTDAGRRKSARDQWETRREVCIGRCGTPAEALAGVDGPRAQCRWVPGEVVTVRSASVSNGPCTSSKCARAHRARFHKRRHTRSRGVGRRGSGSCRQACPLLYKTSTRIGELWTEGA